MPLIFAEKNKELRELFKQNFPDIELVDDMFAVPDPKKIVTCSNPWFSMGGGLDYEIMKRFRAEIVETIGRNTWPTNRNNFYAPGTFIVGPNVLFAVTVDESLRADEKGIVRVLKQIKQYSEEWPEEPIVFTGAGTGIGGLSIERFIELAKQSL